jgi:peptide/nickel transport system substrate-binding protein
MRPYLAAVLALAGTVWTAGCGGREAAGGTVVVGMRSDFEGFDPVTYTDQYTGEVIDYALFTPLIQHDAQLRAQPYLAQSWTMTGDTGIVFQLRDDVRWHDGRPVTAADVKFTFDLAKDPATASLLGTAFLSQVDRAVVLGPYRVFFHFARPHAQALEDFWWAPLPEHLLQGVPPAQLRNSAFNRNPVGSGPYRFVSWQANSQLVLASNPEFPQALGGPPAVKRLVFRIVPEPATMLTELMAGDVQVDIPLLPDQVAQVQADPGLKLFAYPSRTFYYVAWNNHRPPFGDPAVRRAMTLAIDRRQIVDALLHGYGQLATGPIPPWSPLHPSGIAPLPYDTAAAARLLAGAGWVDRNGDGVREDASGRPLRFTLLTSDSPFNKAVAEVIQAQLRRVGVDVQLRVLEFQTMLSQYRSRDYDAVFSTWVMDNFQVASAPVALFASHFATIPMSSNRTGYASPTADSLMERAATATSDATARATWADFIRLMQRDQPFTFLFWFDELAAARNTVRGVTMDPRGELSSMGGWSSGGGG